MEGRRKKGREGGKGGGREGRKEGKEGRRLDVGPDISESCNYSDVLTFYKVSERPGNTGYVYYQAVC